MLISAKSESNDYSLIRMSIDIPWKCDYVKYYISSINTKANILLTTNNDYLIFKTTKNDIRIDFKEAYSYNLNSLVKYLNEAQTTIIFKNIDNRTISLTSKEVVSLKDGSHKAKLITGLFNCKEFIIEANEETFVPDLPILDYANKFYLVSLQGQIVYSTINENEYNPSVLANIDTMIIDNEPIIVNYENMKPIKIKANTDSLKFLELQLVDFLFQPITLKSPLFVSLKIKPSFLNELNELSELS